MDSKSVQAKETPGLPIDEKGYYHHPDGQFVYIGFPADPRLGINEDERKQRIDQAYKLFESIGYIELPNDRSYYKPRVGTISKDGSVTLDGDVEKMVEQVAIHKRDGVPDTGAGEFKNALGGYLTYLYRVNVSQGKYNWVDTRGNFYDDPDFYMQPPSTPPPNQSTNDKAQTVSEQFEDFRLGTTKKDYYSRPAPNPANK